ncbi:MAG: hypothetical protein EZS28_031339, partial [Streblomastix strix]
MAQPDSQNDVVDYKQIVEILKIPFVGSETEKKIILDQQENVCQKIVMKFKDKKDDDGRQNAIETGVTDELSTIFESRDLTSISLPFIEAFFCISFPGDKVDFRPIIYKRKNPYPGLFRLLDHKNSDVVLHEITTIVSILNGGIGSTNDEEQNPHFQSVEECGGIQKLFTLFKKTSDKVIKDKIAVSFGRLFKARPIQDKEMQQSIISHLKSITSDADEWTRSNSALAINHLAQNEDNNTEIMKEFDPLTVIQDLRLPIIGNGEQRKQIQNKKNLDCILLQIIIDLEKDNNLQERLIEAGIIEAFLYFFETQDLNMISSSFVDLFKQFQTSAQTQIDQLKKEKKHYPTILRMLGSSDVEVFNGQNIDIWSLNALARVVGNHTEILKDNFITKAVQVMSNSSDSFLLDFLEIIIDAGTEQTREKIKQEFPVAYIKDLYQHKDSNIRDKSFLFVSRINYPEQMKKLETIQKLIKKNIQDQQTNFNIHEIMNDICTAIEEASENYDEKGGLALIGIKIVHDLIINYKEAIQQELEVGKFIEGLFKLFELPYLSKYV